MLPTCVAEVVCSETFLNTWSDFFLEKIQKQKKNKKKFKKKSQVQKPSNEKIARSVTELIDFVAFLDYFFFFCFQMGLLKST